MQTWNYFARLLLVRTPCTTSATKLKTITVRSCQVEERQEEKCGIPQEESRANRLCARTS